MPSDLPPSGPLTGNVLFYRNPEPLDSRRHAKLGMRTTGQPYGFAARQHVVPAQVGEFGPASVNYPIIFAGENRVPLIVMGLNEGQNLYVGPDNAFRLGAYIPVFIRRYPFIGARDGGAGRSVVCVDRAFEFFTEDNPDVMLFDPDGQPSAFTQRCIDFCSRFDTDSQATISFVNLLNDLDLFETRTTTYTPPRPEGEPPAEPNLIAEFYAVSEDKLKSLPHAKFAELRDNNALGQIYAHMISLHVWERLIAETIARNQQAAEAQATAGRA